jgi:predicted Zn-ribbon and HTH transcriptional regulator
MPSSIENPVDLSDIYDRLESIEKAVRRVGELDRVVYELEQAIRQGKVDTKKIASQLQQIGAQMKSMMSNLQATPGYGAMKTHKCAECGSIGAAAVPIKCTRCGKTSYKGRGVKGGARPTAAKRRPPGARPTSARPAGKRPAVARPR